jgi:alginate O-acetyltransferase complex protein AlgI
LIAIGLAALLGYELPVNFNFPYIANSLSDFCRRWHISLSTWLRDYLYFPLGGNRCGSLRTYFNLMLVMALGGLWHGAAWSYMVWGCYHGSGLAVERFITESVRDRLPSSVGWPRFVLGLAGAVKILCVFCFVSLGWLLFKLTDIHHVAAFIAMLVQKTNSRVNLGQAGAVALYSVPVLLYHLVHLDAAQCFIARWRSSATRSFRWAEDAAFGLMLALIMLNSGTSNAFIYFQF